MKLLGILLSGIVLGYLLGIWIGGTKALEDFGFLSFLFQESYEAHYGKMGAIWGGIIAGMIGFLAQIKK
jgi:hypothetical protein